MNSPKFISQVATSISLAFLLGAASSQALAQSNKVDRATSPKSVSTTKVEPSADLEKQISEIRANWQKVVEDSQKKQLTAIEKLEQRWKPLFDYLDALAEYKLPEGVALKHSFSLLDNNEVDTLKTRIYFENKEGKVKGCPVEFFMMHDRLIATEGYKFLDLDLIQNVPISEIDTLKQALTNWFAEHVGNDFDSDRVSPSVVKTITITRTPDLSAGPQ